MRKISGQLLSSKPVTLSRAAKLISRFAAVDNGSSATVSLYLQRTADAFNNLVQFHSKRLKTGDVESSPSRKGAPQSPKDRSERNSVGKAAQYSNGGDKTGGETVDEIGDANPNYAEVQNLRGEEKKKKKKKSKSDSAVDDSKERISNIEDEVQNLQNGEQEEKKKKRKRKSDSAVDVKEENINVKEENINNAEDGDGNLQSGEKEEEKTKKKKKRKSDAVVPKEEQQ